MLGRAGGKMGRRWTSNKDIINTRLDTKSKILKIHHTQKKRRI